MNRRISINSGVAVPQSFITKGKQRLKQYADTVYLNNGDEFEIELYNPTKTKVLAKVELNGNSIGSGIVLRPGERVFLERFMNDPKKFLFETYTVNGEDSEVQEAISNNGDVAVKFYSEYNPISLTGGYTTSTVTYTSNPLFGNSTYTTGISPMTFTNTSTTLGSTNTAFYNASLSNTTTNKDVETGRVEKGSNSDQSFAYDTTVFNSHMCMGNWWKIKPKSTKPLVSEDLAVYCTECGAKRKKDNHKFCPHCGTKY